MGVGTRQGCKVRASRAAGNAALRLSWSHERRPRMRPLALLVLLAACCVADARAQEVDPVGARLRLADQYLQAGQADRAVALLEDLFAADPASLPLYDRLKEAQLAAGRPLDAVRTVERRIAVVGPSPPLLAEAGRFLALAGDLAGARQRWEEAIALAPHFTQTYRTLYAVMAQARLWEEARDVLLEGRRRLGQPDLYRVELADLHGRLGDYTSALREWAALLEEEPDRLAFVQSRLARAIDVDGAKPALRDALATRIREEPLVLPYRHLAAWLAAEAGDFDAALDHVRAADRLGRAEGATLLAFAENALQAGALDAALRAFDLVRSAHPEATSAAMALLASAAVYEREGERARERPVAADGSRREAPYLDEARARYQRFLEGHPRHPSAPQARYRLARLLLHAYRDAAAAEALLTELLEARPADDLAADARLLLAETAVLAGDLPRARTHLAAVESAWRSGDRADRARYELARLDFYEGHFEAAEAQAAAMKRNTASDTANDAIDLVLLLHEGRGPDSLSTALRAFAEAELLRRQRRADEALTALEAWLAEHAGHTLTDEVRFRRGEVLRTLGRPHEALEAFRALERDHPDSYLADRAAFAAAETLEEDLRDPVRALEAYTDLLVRHPGSLLAPEARTRIRRLRAPTLP